MKFKKLVAFLLAISMILVCSGCKSEKQEEKEIAIHEKVTVAVALAQIGESQKAAMDYMQNYLGPALNIDFIFSSQISSTEEAISFIENAYTAGATGLVDFCVSAQISAEAIDAKCAEYGMAYSTWQVANYLALANRQGTLSAGVGSDAKIIETAAYDWAKGLFTGEGELNLVIADIVANTRNAQQYPTTLGVMKAINENYKLGLSDAKIDELIMNQANVTYTNGSNVNLVLMPGVPGKLGDWDANGAFIEEGKYDQIMIAGTFFDYFMATIDRYEETMNRNFKVYSMAPIGAGTQAGFNTVDKFGNQKLDSAIITTGTAATFALALVLNAIYGDVDVCGEHGVFPSNYSPINSAAEYEKVGLIDTAEEYYALTVDEFKSLIKYYTPDLDYETLYNKVATYSLPGSVIERRNMK